MTMSWKFSCSLRECMISISERAKLSAFGVSKFVVGSSNAKMPQLRQKVSANAKRMMRHAKTFCPAEHRPRMSNSAPLQIMTTR